MICGRFGHEQLGHVSLFDSCMSLCKRTLILVGSAQESGTLRNPFRVETRIDVIRETYPGESEEVLTVRGINDLTNEYDITSDWGKFVKSEAEVNLSVTIKNGRQTKIRRPYIILFFISYTYMSICCRCGNSTSSSSCNKTNLN